MDKIADKRDTRLDRFHQASWNEPIIYELSVKGERGVLVPEVSPAVAAEVGDGVSSLPENMRRENAPDLPEIGQPQLARHYNHLAQENLGVDSNIDIGQGTCTMKYSPKVNDRLAGCPKVADMHPLQPDGTAQGILEIIWRLGELFREISGLDCFSIQPGGGAHGILAMASVVRAYWEAKGESDRDTVVTTFFSHPADAACPIVKGYKAVVLPPDAEGLPDIEAFKATLKNNKVAAIFMTNPEDTGIFNRRIREFTRLAHEAGAICCYDQANANGLLGITRTVEADFDMSFFNLHKTFSSPHGCGGPAVGMVTCRKELRDYLPAPLVERNEEKGYFLDFDLPRSCGKVKSFWGVAPVAVRAYAWIMSLGAEGLREVSRVAILNNNYCMKKILAIKGASISFPNHKPRIEQARYSWERLKKDTGFGTADFSRRIPDYGTHYWSSHEPWVIPEPFTIEPSESYSKADLDRYCDILASIARECYERPEVIREAPLNSTVHHISHDYFDDPAKWALSWRNYKQKYAGYFQPKKK
ncbi:aminomethyl-transferring glycine dehydrogenase subunit GcvPB [Pyramidobacter piscolens]|uniref:aminomethyl-transferring glycine dehydrogenase subunit GcvPB n=1 Tax=Pyramidobacter piscolens TaxID=638849 RepID=UPI003AB210F9